MANIVEAAGHDIDMDLYLTLRKSGRDHKEIIAASRTPMQFNLYVAGVAVALAYHVAV
jgi:hypothetical protein